MRVLHLDTELTWRGGENQLRLLLEGMKARGFATHVAVRPRSLARERLADLANLCEVEMRGGFAPRAAWTLKTYCDAHDIQVIDAHTSNAHALALLVKAMRPELGLVVHRRVDYRPQGGWLNRRKYASPKVDRYVAISHGIAAVLRDYGVPASKLAVVRSAVDGAVYRTFDRAAEKAQLARAYGVSPELVFIGNASAMTEQKGYDVFLRAMRRLKDRGLPFHAFVAGDGHLRDPLEKLRIELELEHTVSFLGFIAEVPRFLTALDVLAVPSNYEGLGTILLDGTFAGLALAATRVGGIPEVVIHGQTGLLSPVGDDAAHAANLARLIEDPQLRARLAAAAREHVTREFSLQGMVEGNLAVYRAVLGELTR